MYSLPEGKFIALLNYPSVPKVWNKKYVCGVMPVEFMCGWGRAGWVRKFTTQTFPA